MPGGARDQIIGGGTPTDLPGTINTLPMYSIGGLNAHITDSVFKQADSGHQLIAGIAAAVNAGQVATKPAIAFGDSASAWGDGAVAIGKSAVAGNSAAKDGAISIGSLTVDAKNGISVGSALAFGAGAFDECIHIGTQAVAIRNGAIAFGKGATAGGTDGVAIGTSSIGSEGSSVAIGRGASCTSSGLGTPNKNVAIGDAATCNPSFTSSAGGVIAIGAGSSTNAQNACAIGASAAVTGTAVVNSIALGAFTSVTTSNTLGVGDATNAPVNNVSIRAAAGVPIRHSLGGSGSWRISDASFTTDFFDIDASATAGDIRMRVYDVTAAALKRVTVGAADSGGVGFKVLRVLN